MDPRIWPIKRRRPARTFIQQLCDDTGCNPEDLPKAMNDRETWRERVGISVLAARHDDDVVKGLKIAIILYRRCLCVLNNIT